MELEPEFGLCCVNCGKTVGAFSPVELEEMPDSLFDGVLCFDCDKESAATVPSLFWQWEAGDIFVLGDKEFMIAEHFGNGGEMFEVPRTREHARARSCLSSSTYLHKTYPNQSPETKKTVNDAECPKCGLNTGEVWYDGIRCTNCGWYEGWEKEIVLPSWVVAHPAFVEAIGSNPEIWCSGCGNARKTGANYCDYHHALLIEQSEDGSLGWLNEQA